jgi:hypothetical protein
MSERGISNERLAVLSGVGSRQIARYRVGRNLPRDYFGHLSPNALKLARALGVDAETLFPPRPNNGGDR